MGVGIGEFFRSGAYESAGFSRQEGGGVRAFEGYGQSWQRSGAMKLSHTGKARNPIRNMIGTVARVGPLGMLGSVVGGYSEEGIWGAGKWAAAEIVASAFTVNAVAMGGSEGAAMVGGVIGSVFGGPGGYAAGAGIGATMGFGGLSIAGAGMAWLAGGVGGTYLAAKGSYELLKAGYGYRQMMKNKIDTAGPTAAFMTKNAYTMRTRAVEAIRGNQLNARSAFGQEANKMHFSAYRKWGSRKAY